MFTLTLHVRRCALEFRADQGCAHRERRHLGDWRSRYVATVTPATVCRRDGGAPNRCRHVVRSPSWRRMITCYNHTMNAPTSAFLEKARESLAGAESEYVNERYNNCANRCYYACFQAAIHALQQARIRPGGGQWGHDFVQGQFIGLLINRRKGYPA